MRERPENAPAPSVADGSAAVSRRRGFSLLRASIGERLGIVGALLALLWLAVYWALQ